MSPPASADVTGTTGGPRGGLPTWVLLTVLVVFGANALANFWTGVTIELMRSMTEFARQVRAFDETLVLPFNVVAFAVPGLIGLIYLWPLIRHARAGYPVPASLSLQRRVISAPVFFAALGFAPWLMGIVLFPIATIAQFGRWSTDLMSQHVLSPLVNGFLAAATSYLFVDLIFRRRVVPRVFPGGRLADVDRALTLNLRGRLLIFLLAIAFVPLFTLLGLVRSAAVRTIAGQRADEVMPRLTTASETAFVVFILLGLTLALALARTLNRPLGAMAQTLRRVRAGDLEAGVPVTSSDEVGILEDGVNAMVSTLRERERILQTFGRVVEPAIRDRLLAGDLQAGGELRSASVLFLDLRDFSGLAERTPPAEVVATLNSFFALMTGWVRQCGGYVDKFVGDGMLVIFGLFTEQTEKGRATAAAAAVRCAMGMHERLAELNDRRVEAERVPLAIKVGVHSGDVVAGTIGAADRHDYTVIGDTVNIAARLQQLCREHGVGTLISEATYRLAAAAGEAPAVATTAAVTLRGRASPVMVYGIGTANGEG